MLLLAYPIFSRNYYGNILAPSSVIFELVSIKDDKIELIIFNSSSACVMKKCDVERLDNEVNIIAYETAWITQGISGGCPLSIDLDGNIKRVYIKGLPQHPKKLIWERADEGKGED